MMLKTCFKGMSLPEKLTVWPLPETEANVSVTINKIAANFIAALVSVSKG
jgi:hypothetical protein